MIDDMEASGPAYLFEALTGFHEIRLLQLDPGGADDQLSGRLQRVNLDGKPFYEALSYEWGNPEKTHKISLEDRLEIFINKSLWHALRDLRYEIRAHGSRIL